MESKYIKRLKRDIQLVKKESPQFEITINENDNKIIYINFIAPENSIFKGEKYWLINKFTI